MEERVFVPGDYVNAHPVSGQHGRFKRFPVFLFHAAHGGEEARVRAGFEIIVRRLFRHRRGELAEGLAVLDVDVEVLRRVGIERRSQNGAVAQSARPELHAALHPGHDPVLRQLIERGCQQLLARGEEAEAELAVFEHLLDLLGREIRAEAERPHRAALAPPMRAAPGVVSRADGRAAVARSGLHEDVVPAAAALERGHQQSVERQPAGQAEIAAFTREVHDDGFRGRLDARRKIGLHCFRDFRAFGQTQRFIEARAEPARLAAVHVEPRRIHAEARGVLAQNLAEYSGVLRLAGNRQPLDLVLFEHRTEAQQLGDAAVKVAERIRVGHLRIQRKVRAFGAPARAAAEVAHVVHGHHGGAFERRSVVGGGGVRAVVIHAHHARLREEAAQFQMNLAGAVSFPQRARQGHSFDIPALDAGHFQRHAQRFRRQIAAHMPGRRLLLFDGGCQLSVFENGAGGILLKSAQSNNDHACPVFSFFSTFAHVSRSPTVRLNTIFSGVVSGSTQK